MQYEIKHGDCLEVLRDMPENSVDAIVTDPPYGLSFMGKKWDYDIPSVDIWRECLRALKPGGHLLSFAGTRTQHRMACAIEDAGFEIRDMIAWVYGSGFPKSLDVSKAIDKAAGAEREVVGLSPHSANRKVGAIWNGTDAEPERKITAPATDAARQWQGWGTALKPSLEPISAARKPLHGTVAANVLEHGTGALNVDGCRVGTTVETWPASRSHAPGQMQPGGTGRTQATGEAPPGRWPANLIYDGGDETTEILAGAARFFYCAKASKRDRDEGCEGMDIKHVTCRPDSDDENDRTIQERLHGRKARNYHPTVKPTDLMRYLCRLVTPPGGLVLDPFMGSGSTGKAAMLERFRFIGIERETEYVEIAMARIEAAKAQAESMLL